MKDQRFVIYNEPYCSLFGDITGGCLHIESDLDEDDMYPGSEKHYRFSKEDTARLFRLISLRDFISLCRKQRLTGLETFLAEHGIRPETMVF